MTVKTMLTTIAAVLALATHLFGQTVRPHPDNIIFGGDTRNFSLHPALPDGVHVFKGPGLTSLALVPALCADNDGLVALARVDIEKNLRVRFNYNGTWQMKAEKRDVLLPDEVRRGFDHPAPIDFVGAIIGNEVDAFGLQDTKASLKYDLEGIDPNIYFGKSGEKVKGERWKWVHAKKWVRDYDMFPVQLFHLTAMDGKYAGWCVDCEKEEILKDRDGLQYVRWRAKLVKEPGDFSSLYIRQERRHQIAP